MKNNNSSHLFGSPQLGLSRHPIVRLPVGRELAGFAFPKTADPATRARFASRKIPIISAKNLKHLGRLDFETTHAGTLKRKPFLN